MLNIANSADQVWDSVLKYNTGQAIISLRYTYATLCQNTFFLNSFNEQNSSLIVKTSLLFCRLLKALGPSRGGKSSMFTWSGGRSCCGHLIRWEVSPNFHRKAQTSSFEYSCSSFQKFLSQSIKASASNKSPPKQHPR